MELDKFKNIKIRYDDGTLSESVPIYVDAANVDMGTGNSLSGTIDNINGEISNLKSKKIYTFNTVAEMKSINYLKNGDVVETLGYYAANDGGNGLYKIRTKVNGDVEDNGYIHFLNNNLIAELIIENNKINVKQFGAKGDGISDDTANCKKAIESAKSNSRINEVHFPSGKYIITNTILENGIDGLIISGENADYSGTLNTTIVRGADITIFNASGTITLTNRIMCKRMQFKNLYITDKSSNYSNEIAFKIYYSMYFKFEDCLFSCYNKMFSFRNFYDSRFINCDFTTGGNSSADSALINIDCGKHASSTEIGWDNTNSIIFNMCRFERYRGTAIKTTLYIQPTTYNQTYDPCLGINANKIFLDMCKFESPYLTSKPVLDFNNASSLYFNTEITVLDGQTEMLSVINFNEVSNVYGFIRVGYYQTTVTGVTYSDFENPLIKMNKCEKFDLGLIIGQVYDHYKLDYFIDCTANDNTYRTINIRVPYSYKKKKIFNTSSLPLNIATQGILNTYGESSNNGLRMLYANDVADEWRIASQFSNNNHQLRFLYKYGDNTTNNPILMNGNEGGVSNIQFNSLLTLIGGLNLSRETIVQTNTSRSNRYIGYGSSAPAEGFWLKGDIIYNNNPSSGGKIGWVCVTGGANSVWKTFGTID